MREARLQVHFNLRQQRCGGAGGVAAMLFPVSEGRDFYADELGKFVLAGSVGCGDKFNKLLEPNIAATCCPRFEIHSL